MANENENQEAMTPQIIESSQMMQVIVKAEFDSAIMTAKNFPRDVEQCRKDAISIVTMDEETAEACFYVLPPRKQKQQDGTWKDVKISGPGVRMAEIVLNSWGNIKAATRIIGNDGKSITAEAIVIDLQKNVTVSQQVVRSIVDSQGRTYNQNLQVMTANAASSVALRNATFKVVPAVFTKAIAAAAQQKVIGNPDELVDRISKAFQFFWHNYRITEERVLRVVNRIDMKDCTADDLITLRGIMTAIKDEISTVEEAFPLATNSDVHTNQAKANDALKNTADNVSKQSGTAKLKKLKFGQYKLQATEDCQVPDHEGTIANFLIGDVVMAGTVEGIFVADELYFKEPDLLNAKFERAAL